jgi:hypothetical protein
MAGSINMRLNIYKRYRFIIVSQQNYIKFAIYMASQETNHVTADTRVTAMKKYKDKKTGLKVVEVKDLSFLRERNHKYGWFRRHYKHLRVRRALKKAGKVVAADPVVAADIYKYYRIPKDHIILK